MKIRYTTHTTRLQLIFAIQFLEQCTNITMIICVWRSDVRRKTVNCIRVNFVHCNIVRQCFNRFQVVSQYRFGIFVQRREWFAFRQCWTIELQHGIVNIHRNQIVKNRTISTCIKLLDCLQWNISSLYGIVYLKLPLYLLFR